MQEPKPRRIRSSEPALQRRILTLLKESGPLSTRAISWKLGPTLGMVKEELLPLQREGMVFVSYRGLLDDDWAITEKGQKRVQKKGPLRVTH
ncbi:MAG: hypothetical protein ACE5KO_01475 [Candidatus Bathyarchaeia archaeon]